MLKEHGNQPTQYVYTCNYGQGFWILGYDAGAKSLFVHHGKTLLFIELSIYVLDRCFCNEKQILLVRHGDSILMGRRFVSLHWLPVYTAVGWAESGTIHSLINVKESLEPIWMPRKRTSLKILTYVLHKSWF